MKANKYKRFEATLKNGTKVTAERLKTLQKFVTFSGTNY